MANIKEIAEANFPTTAEKPLPLESPLNIAAAQKIRAFIPSGEEMQARTGFTPEGAAAALPDQGMGLKELGRTAITIPEEMMKNISQLTGGIIPPAQQLEPKLLRHLLPGVNIPTPDITPTPAAKLLGQVGAYQVGEEALGPLAALRGIKAIPGIARRALGSAAFGGATTPQHPILGAALWGAGSPAAELGTQGGSALLDIARGKRSPEQIQQILKTLPAEVRGKALKGVPLADLLQSTPAAVAQTVAEKIPFSGATVPYEQLAMHMKDFGENTVKKLEGFGADDIDSQLYNGMKNEYLKKKANWQSVHKNFLDLADQIKPKEFIKDNIKDVVDSAKKDLEERKGAYEEPLLSDDRKEMDKLLNVFDPNKLKINNLKKYEIYKEDLNSLWAANKAKGNTGTLNLISRLKDAVRKDLRETTKPFPELADSLKESDRIWANEVKPFEKIGKKDTPFKGYLNLEKESEQRKVPFAAEGFASKHLPTTAGQADKTRLMKELISRSEDPEKTQQLLLSHHLTPTLTPTNEVKPNTLISQFRKLNPDQQKSLFGSLTPEMHRLNVWKNVFPKSFETDVIPKTGYQTALTAPYLGLGLLGAAGEEKFAGKGHPILRGLAGGLLGGAALSRGLRSREIAEIAAGLKKTPLTTKLAKPAILSELSKLLNLRGEKR